MIIRRRFLLLIHILYCAVTIHGILLDANDAETCNLLCVQCNASAVFANDHCECNSADDSDKDAECIQRIQREIQAIELNMLSEDPTDEERNVRSILKYRRRLRPGDAEKVAQYFIDGGPAAGHSHFIRAFNSTDSAANSFSGVVDKINPEDGFHGASLTNPISWNIYDSPLYMVSESAPYASPTMQGAEYLPILRAANPGSIYPTNELYEPMIPLGTIHPHGLPHALMRAVTLPGHILHHVLHPRVYHRPLYHRPLYHRGIVRSTNDGSGTAIGGQSCENNDSSTTSNLPTARNNADKSADQNILGLIDSSQYPGPYVTQAMYQPMQYQHFPYHTQYTSCCSPLMNMQPITNGYVLQPLSHYAQDTSDPLTSVANPYSSCENNANTDQQSRVLPVDKTHSNEKSRNKEKKTEENGTDKS